MSLRKTIQNTLHDIACRDPEQWVNGGHFERMALELGYKASNASRRCRELVNDGYFERMEKDGSVWYRYAKEKLCQPA